MRMRTLRLRTCPDGRQAAHTLPAVARSRVAPGRKALPYLLAALLTAPAWGDSLIVAGGTVHPVSGESFVGDVLVTDGEIAAAGPGLEAPDGAQRIDATGLHVYPGLFDALSQLGLVEIGAVPATDDQTEMGDYNPHLKAATAVHPDSQVIPVARANGITHTLVSGEADQDSVIVGQAALSHLDGWTVEEMGMDDSMAMVIRWPAIVTRRFDFSTFSIRESPFNEAKEAAEEKQADLREWLKAARHYAQASAATPRRAERDLKLEALIPVVEGRQPVVVIASAKRDIEAAVEFAEEEGLKMILAGGTHAWELAELLAEKEVPVILGFTLSNPQNEDDPYDRPFRNPAELAAAGVRFAFGSGAGGGFGPGGPHASRTLPYEAAAAVAFGLDAGEALRALTLYPAEMLGMGDKLGTIEPGKIANLIVTDGDPLEITTQIRHVIIDGKESSTDNRHESLYRRYRAR